MLSPFLACLTEQLEKKGYGEKRQAEIVDRFNGLREQMTAQGVTDPDTLAMARVLDELDAATRVKNRLAYDALLKRSLLGEHFETFNYNKSIVTDGKVADPGVAAVALLSADSRSKSGLNVETYAQVFRNQVWGTMNDVLTQIGKGAFGIQRGKAHMDSIVDEIFGQTTGDHVAAQIAKAWQKGSGTLVDLWNMAGGAMNRLEGWGLPQQQSMVKVIKAGAEAWVADHMNWLAWDKMHWPNGAPIKPEDRIRVLEAVYDTLSSDGGNKIKPGSFEGDGAAIGNLLEQQRFMIFKDGPSWREMHTKYGDGNVFDVMANYVDQMTHKMGLVKVFGSNVENGMDLVRTLALQKAVKEGGGQMKVQTSATLSRFDLLAEQALRRNAMDPESTGANVVIGTSNLLNSAQLAGAVLAAVPGDFATTMVMRAANHMPVLDGLIGPYARGLVNQAEAQSLAAESHFLMDSVVHTLYTKTRFAGLAEYGPAWTKRIADITMRASGMNVHTDVLRWVNQQHMMGMMARSAESGFDDLPFKAMMEKYGITSDMWDRLRALPTYSPREGVNFIRPADILQTGAAGKQDIYERFQMMILQESKNMVIDTNPEANTMLKGNMRPDTIPGALLHSFAMYKNFPIGLALTYGRVAMSIEGRPGRLSFVAGLGTSLLLAGAVGLQLREISKGRDALPMDTAGFWGKALLASGAMSIWGDFLFNGVNKVGSPTDMAAGPVVGFVGDTAQLAFGDMFEWADTVGTLKADKLDKKTPFGAKATEYLSRYTPGSSLWFARAALQREIFDPLRMLSDPRGAIKMDRKERQRVKDFGNESWWEPGSAFPSRAPRLLTESPQ